MTDVTVLTTTGPATSQVYVTTGPQGPSGPAGPPGYGLPDPAGLADGRLAATQAGAWVAITPPAGTGDMTRLIYDPQGVAANCFNLANLSGNLDAGTF